MKIGILGTGMVGSAIVRKLQAEGYSNIITRGSKELDLKDQGAVRNFFEKEKPDVVVLAAAKVGGIHANNVYRAQFLYENLMIESNVIHSSYENGVKKLLFLGSSCIYPKMAPQPLKEESLLTGLLEQGSTTRRLREDAALEQVHWATNRARQWPQVLAFAFDHRPQFEEICAKVGADPERIPLFKQLALSAAMRTTAGRPDGGILLDGRFGQEALDRATGNGLWIARPIELPGSCPLRFEGGADLGSTLREWPAEHCVKCLVF